jgi:hypothetical protein
MTVRVSAVGMGITFNNACGCGGRPELGPAGWAMQYRQGSADSSDGAVPQCTHSYCWPRPARGLFFDTTQGALRKGTARSIVLVESGLGRLVAGFIEELALVATMDGNSRGIELRVMPVEDGVVIEAEPAGSCGGLPSGNVNELFRPFEQRGADRTGLGLGLAFSRWGVEANDARHQTNAGVL